MARLRLERMVTMRGAVDFRATLVPEIRSEVEAYLMLHHQSDPSCTCVGTLACGMPVVGYGNKALGSIPALADVGVSVAMDDVAAAAAAVRALDADRSRLARKARHPSAFARRHSFEDSEAESFSAVPERRAKTPPIQAQSAAIARAMASICNDERGRFGVQGGHGRKTLSLSDELLDFARRRAAGQSARHAGCDVEGDALRAPSRRS